jgi:hypothetical protein
VSLIYKQTIPIEEFMKPEDLKEFLEGSAEV